MVQNLRCERARLFVRRIYASVVPFTLSPIFTDYQLKICRKPLLSWKIIKPIHFLTHTHSQLTMLYANAISNQFYIPVLYPKQRKFFSVASQMGVLASAAAAAATASNSFVFEFIWTNECTCNDWRNTHEEINFLMNRNWIPGKHTAFLRVFFCEEYFTLCEFSSALFSVLFNGSLSSPLSLFFPLVKCLTFLARALSRCWRNFYKQTFREKWLHLLFIRVLFMWHCWIDCERLLRLKRAKLLKIDNTKNGRTNERKKREKETTTPTSKKKYMAEILNKSRHWMLCIYKRNSKHLGALSCAR